MIHLAHAGGVFGGVRTAGHLGALYLSRAPPIRLNFWQIRREADFRFGLMRLRENAESIAFYRASPRSAPSSTNGLPCSATLPVDQEAALTNLTSRFSQLTLVLPAIILANDVLSGELEGAPSRRGRFAAVQLCRHRDNFESLSRLSPGLTACTPLSQVSLVKHLRPPTPR